MVVHFQGRRNRYSEVRLTTRRRVHNHWRLSERSTSNAMKGSARAARPEKWSVKVDGADVAALDIPADAQRDRRFQIDCRFVVRADPAARAPWHEMNVSVDGSLEWSRRIETQNPDATDSLDVHFRRDLPAGHDLRIVASTRLHGGTRVSLEIEAEEDRP
jgi:hypothetical protein